MIAAREMEEQYYVFLAISEYGFGGGTVYLIDKDTGEAFSFDTMTS